MQFFHKENSPEALPRECDHSNPLVELITKYLPPPEIVSREDLEVYIISNTETPQGFLFAEIRFKQGLNLDGSLKSSLDKFIRQELEDGLIKPGSVSESNYRYMIQPLSGLDIIYSFPLQSSKQNV